MSTSGSAPPDPRAEIERRRLGHGLALRSIGPDSIGQDVVFADGPAGKDLALVAGVENLAQDLAVALLTAAGSDLFNVRFGFDGLRVLTADLEPVMVQEMLRLAVLRTVGTDGRIAEVLDLRLEPIDAPTRRWRVEVELRTVLGVTTSFFLGEVEAGA